MRALDLAGKRFGRWTIVVRAETLPGYRELCWLCRCDCGTVRTVGGGSLRSGASAGCGCVLAEVNRARLTTHGHAAGTGTAEYRSWSAMRTRCRNPNDSAFPDYGGRGIAICERWDSFDLFLADMGPRPSPHHSIDRFPDMNGNYEPGNCRWATAKEQANNRRSSRLIAFNGRDLTIAQWAEVLGMRSGVIRGRMFRGETNPARLLAPVRRTA